MQVQGGGGIDVSLANSDPLRMIGVEAAITGDSLGADSSAVECSVTLLGYQVESTLLLLAFRFLFHLFCAELCVWAMCVCTREHACLCASGLY